jgi:hypothetical protein
MSKKAMRTIITQPVKDTVKAFGTTTSQRNYTTH